MPSIKDIIDTSGFQWHYPVTLVYVAFITSMSNNLACLIISPVLPDIIATFDTSNGMIGFPLTGMLATCALLQFPSGVLGDRCGERIIIRVATRMTALSGFVLAFALSLWLFGLFALFLGAGAGLYFTVGTFLLTKQFDEYGQILGIHSTRGPIAGLIASLAGVSLAVRYG